MPRPAHIYMYTLPMGNIRVALYLARRSAVIFIINFILLSFYPSLYIMMEMRALIACSLLHLLVYVRDDIMTMLYTGDELTRRLSEAPITQAKFYRRYICGRSIFTRIHP